MRSLKELFRIGKGPSSSHTMGPQKASEIFKQRNPQTSRFEVTLYGSLAATGKGHMTDAIIIETLSTAAPVDIVWQPSVFLPFHPNGMRFVAKDANGNDIDEWTVYSIGGGALSEGKKEGDMFDTEEIYNMNSLTEIMHWCEKTGRSYWEYVEQCETKDIWDYLHEVWMVMQAAVERGLNREGVLPGPLGLPRKAATYYVKASGYKQTLQTRGLVYAYALAVSECLRYSIIYIKDTISLKRVYYMPWPLLAYLAISSRKMLLYLVPTLVVKARLAWLVPWLQQLRANCLVAVQRKLNMLLKWD